MRRSNGLHYVTTPNIALSGPHESTVNWLHSMQCLHHRSVLKNVMLLQAVLQSAPLLASLVLLAQASGKEKHTCLYSRPSPG
jgi:hypothetical protein